MVDKSFWYRCIENLKPGAYGIVFSPYKVYHRVASVIEDTGFEIKDMILWLYSIEDRILCETATLIRKPIAESSVAENVIKWGVGIDYVNKKLSLACTTVMSKEFLYG